MLERHLESHKEAGNAAVMYFARLETRATVYDTACGWNRAHFLSRRSHFVMRVFVTHDIRNNPTYLALCVQERWWTLTNVTLASLLSMTTLMKL